MSTDIEPVDTRQPPHYAPDEPRAQAIALAAEGYSGEHISELVSIPVRTVRRWIARGRELADNKPILDRWKRVTLQAQELIGDGLDNIEEDASGQSALKHLKELNFIAGTGTDKLQKDTTPTVQAQNVLIVVNAQKPDDDIVEGEVVE